MFTPTMGQVAVNALNAVYGDERNRMTLSTEGRHPAVVDIARFFEYGHLPPHLREVSEQVAGLAQSMIDTLPDCAELTTGLRKLLEAKDCFVRAALPIP